MTRSAAVHLVPDPRRVITKPFLPRGVVGPSGASRVQIVVERVLAMSERTVRETLRDAEREAAGRHRDVDAILDRRFETVASLLEPLDLSTPALSPARRRLIGTYFTSEYSIESAALGNPSIVPGPDQSDVEAGEVRFVMSLRAIGEGHISSIEFRSGVVGTDGDVRLDPVSRYATTGSRTPHSYDKAFFTAKLAELTTSNAIGSRVLARLGERFTMAELEESIATLEDEGVDPSISGETTHVLHWLASSNYWTSFPTSMDLSERVLFPNGPTESHGMEDARFVRFVDDDGSVAYFATYTAFDGHQILPQLIETSDFVEFRIATLSGPAARNKGIAIFPRRIGGELVALGRHDNVNNYLMTSNDIRRWSDAVVIQEPERPWELMQLGNCGSPIETEAGWLVITHGVGPFRRYTLGALLLDIDDPGRVIGHLGPPLLAPADDERDGYVPNVVYSCGSMIHAGHLVVPYGYADVATRIATISVDALLDRLTPTR